MSDIRLRLLQSPDHCTPERLQYLAALKNGSDDLRSTITYALGRGTSVECNSSISSSQNEIIEPYLADLLAWPLTIASSLSKLDARQRLWFKSELANIGRIIGTGVLECAETSDWDIQ